MPVSNGARNEISLDAEMVAAMASGLKDTDVVDAPI
jgi:hypothetical protein